jgi:hypothetical protein
MRELVTLAEAAARQRMLNVACSRCQRRGRLSLARLIAEHGPDTPVRMATANLNVDCPRRNSPNWAERCDIYYPG